MRLSSLLTVLCGATLLTHCSGALPTIGEQSDVQQLYTNDAVAVAFVKARNATMRCGATVIREDAHTGTIQATAYRGRVTVFLLIQPAKGQTRVEAVARTEPGTFSHGKLDLASRILDQYLQEG
jgi:hypothetical protein